MFDVDSSITQWHRNKVNIAGQDELEGLRGGVLGEGLGECCKLFYSRIRSEAPADRSFGAFWVLQMSSNAVLLRKTV